jgi:sulfatase maturation enzyme AslB (radical SAM superfamily)
MTFCFAPWSNLEILPTGDILPCCKFQGNHYADKFNIRQHTIDEYRQSVMLTGIKQQFQQGQWPSGCDRCRIEEENKIESKRQLDYTRWKHHYDDYNLDNDTLLTVSLALGNTCNLKCIICSPYASSKWSKEYKDLYSIEVASIEDVRQDVIGNLTTIAPNLVHIDMHGGEPLLSGIEQHRALLDYYINNGQSRNVTIHYTTNATLFPDATWIQRWEHFAEVDLQLSIDGIQRRYEYQRYPADWDTLVANVNKYLELQQHRPNIKLSVAHTVSAYNIFYIDEFVQWCNQVGLPKPWIGKLHRPEHLRPSVWPEPAKEIIINKLQSSAIEEVHVWANLMQTTDDSKLFEQFRQFVQRHDQYRSLNFQTTFPELAKYLND